MINLGISSLESLFISKVRIKALKYFTLNPDRPLHLRGAVREMNEEINAVRRELSRLEEIHLLRVEAKGNRRYYSANLDHPFFSELLSLFHKSYGLGGEILSNIKKLGEIEYVFLTPTFTKGIYQGVQVVDMVVIGNVNMLVIEEIVKRVQESIGKEIHYMILKPTDFELRKRRRDQLVIDLMVQDNIMVFGKYEDFIK